MKPTTVLLTLLISLLMTASTMPSLAAREKVRRNITFIVRKPDKIRHIAARFHVAPKQITSLNDHVRKGTMVYAGKALVIPVTLRLRANLAKEPTDFNLADYRLDTDSLDEYIGEDFVNTAEIEADTVRRARIDHDTRILDKKLRTVYASYDSALRVDEAELAELSIRDQKRLLIARMRANPHAAINAELDSLTREKSLLIGEKGKINARISDYENLVENASYMAAHPEEAAGSGTFIINEWGGDPSKTPDEPKSKKSKK